MHTIIETEAFEKLWPLYWTEKEHVFSRFSLQKIRVPEMWLEDQEVCARSDGRGLEQENPAVCA